MATAATSTEDRIKEQRRALPDAPGVYIFRDAKSKVLYVGKARSIRKRVGGHFSKPGARGAADMVAQIADIEFIATETEAEALLAEQEFIKRYRPLFNVRLRDDKSYPYIGISLDEEFPRIYFTRERHRRGRAYFGPFSNAKRVRETLDLLGKVFQYRTCDGPQPGRASGSPCLDYHIHRCQAPCVGYISKEEYRENVETIVDFLSGRYRQIERALDQGMKKAAAEQEFEQAAQYRNKLKAVRSLLERQRISNEAVGHARRDRRGGRGNGRERPGVPGARRRARRPPELLPRERRAARRVRGRRGVRAPVLRERGGRAAAGRGPALRRAGRHARRGARRAARRARRGPSRRARRQAPHPRARRAQRAARARPGPAALGAPALTANRGARRPPARARHGGDPDADRVLRHLAADGRAPGGVDGGVRGWRAEEVRLPALWHPGLRSR